MQAGVYRSTMPVIPPSAAFGLVLNLAGIEMRGEDVGTTLISPDLPRLRLAVGTVHEATVSTLYQQLHSYPVGSSGKEFKARSHGTKNWIAPVRREILVGLDAVIAVESENADLLNRVKRGGSPTEPRYGLPFAGDNNFLFDRIDFIDSPPPVRWYCGLSEANTRTGSVRLTVSIDRADQSRTQTVLVAPCDPCITPPENAWHQVPAA